MQQRHNHSISISLRNQCNHSQLQVGLVGSLHSIRQSLVQLSDLGRNAEVDGTVTDLDNETTNEVRVDLYQSASETKLNKTEYDTHLGNDLELLTLAKLGLGNSLFHTRDGLVIEFLPRQPQPSNQRTPE